MKLKLYPHATQRQRRLSVTNPTLHSIRLKLFKLTTLNFILLQLLFFCLFCYIFGALYRERDNTHNLSVVFVDYDGGIIGDSVRQAYLKLQGNEFPTLVERSPLQYPQPSALESSVCNIDYWAALYVAPGASSRLAEGLTGGTPASSYNRSDAIFYIWNGARYSTTGDTVATHLSELSEAARLAYSSINGTGALQTIPAADAAAVSVFSNPWDLVSLNIQPTTQGSRLIYNTLVIILILLQEFFYLGTINALLAQFQIYGRISPRRIIIFRLAISVLYTFVGSLCATGAIWAFRRGWDVSGKQFVLTWMTLWLFAHLNFLTFDVFSVWLPPAFLAMSLISWVIINITSILLPFALSPNFYRWAYALPTHAVYNVLIDIWSGGCNPSLSYGLPVMFAYELSSLGISMLGVYRRSHLGFIALENEEKAFQNKIAAALAQKSTEDTEGEGIGMMRSSEIEEAEEAGTAPISKSLTEVETARPVRRVRSAATVADYEMAERIWRDTAELRLEQERSRTRRDSNIGPCFNLPFSD